MPHFLINSSQIKNNSIFIDDKELFHHIVKVLRVKKGEKLLFLDENKIQYETLIYDIQNRTICAEIQKKYKSKRMLNLNLYVAQSVLNSDNQISSIQKATESGVKGIIPLLTDNCSVKENVINAKIEKWQKIVLQTVKQCERCDIPFVFEVSNLEEIINKYDKTIVFAEKYADKNFFEYLKSNPIDKKQSILIVIGPEGGFSEREFIFFKQNNIPLITLGNLIYRADTALCAAITTVVNGVLYV